MAGNGGQQWWSTMVNKKNNNVPTLSENDRELTIAAAHSVSRGVSASCNEPNRLLRPLAYNLCTCIQSSAYSQVHTVNKVKGDGL